MRHNPRCAIFHEPPSLRDANDCNCGAIPPLSDPPDKQARHGFKRPPYSDAELADPPDKQTPEDRFWAKVDRRGPDECSRKEPAMSDKQVGERWTIERLTQTGAWNATVSGPDVDSESPVEVVPASTLAASEARVREADQRGGREQARADRLLIKRDQALAALRELVEASDSLERFERYGDKDGSPSEYVHAVYAAATKARALLPEE